MLKYANTQVVFQEFPGETTLAINITGCIHHCPGCHSPHLWRDEGHPLDIDALSCMIDTYKNSITCVGFMGGDHDIETLHRLVGAIRLMYPGIHIGWYSGNDSWTDEMIAPFDYVKFGSYKKDLGGLDSPGTNQVMYKHIHNGVTGPQSGSFSMWLNITPYFWKETSRELKDVYLKTNYESIAIINRVTKNTSLFTMNGLTTDGYETHMEPPTEENFVKGYIMNLNGHVPPEECGAIEYRRKVGEKEWEKIKPGR